MNKKFFAALASATMAFTASGSIAVFADDFVEEANVVDPGDITPVETEVVWNEDNFGILVKDGIKFTGYDAAKLNDGDKVKTADLAKVTKIDFTGSNLEGEIKGLEYFTGLTTFTDAGVKKLTNKTLDFSASTKLTSLTVTTAGELAGITLPNPEVKEDKKEAYHLATLDLEGTKLTKLDLSAQETLVADKNKSSITVKGNKNLKEVTLKKATSATTAKLATLDLSGNALETVNLNNFEIGTLDLSNNHIGALDLSKTTATTATLSGQTFYVYEKAANVNLKEAFADLDVDYVEAKGFDSETGVLDLKTASHKYDYNTKVGTATQKLKVTLVPANPMNRLYNPNSGEHFYTVDVKEKAALVALGWQDEGYGWVAPKGDAKNVDKVYRLYNPNAGDHHYTMDENEVKTLVAYGWKDEGTGWLSASKKGVAATTNAKNVDVYRQYNPYANGAGSHNYTTDKAENDYLVSLGWTPEGVAWTALQ